MKVPALLLALLPLASCNDAAPAGPAAVTKGERRAIDDAAQMLEDDRGPATDDPTEMSSGSVLP